MSTRPIHILKVSEAWQLECWKRWPREEDWPGVMDLYEAGAFLRVNPATIRRACQPDRNGRARLAHQRMGSAYRITKRALQSFGAVKERNVA